MWIAARRAPGPGPHRGPFSVLAVLNPATIGVGTVTVTVGATVRVTADTSLIAMCDPASASACRVAADVHNVASPPRPGPAGRRQSRQWPMLVAWSRAAFRRAAWQVTPPRQLEPFRASRAQKTKSPALGVVMATGIASAGRSPSHWQGASTALRPSAAERRRRVHRSIMRTCLQPPVTVLCAYALQAVRFF